MRKLKIFMAVVFFGALVLRVLLLTSAHHGDLNNNISWGTIAYEKGLNGFYDGYSNFTWPYSAPNQPPLTIEMFALARLIWQKLRDLFWYMNWTLLIFPSKLVWFWDEKGMDILVKLPPVLADLGIGYFIYQYVTKVFKKPEKFGLILSTIWLYNPITWYVSAVWGQTDSIVNLLGLVAIFYLIKRDLIFFGFFFTLSILFKGSLSIFIPILFFIAFYQRHSLKTWFFTIITSLSVVTMVSLWFHPNWDLLFWLYELYKERFLPGEIGFLTANAFNFWWLVDPGNILDSVRYFIFSARVWGFLIVISVLAYLINWLKEKVNDKNVFIVLSMTALTTFLFLTRIHERYLYPFFPISTIVLSFNPFYWPIYSILSLTYLINLFNLFWIPTIPFLRALLGNLWFTNFLSVLNLFMLALSFRHLKPRKV